MLDIGEKFKNKKILVYGFGKTGKSSFNFLKNNNNLTIYDDNHGIIPKKVKKLYFRKSNVIRKQNFEYIVMSPGINIKNSSLKYFLKKNKKKIISDLDIFYFFAKNNKKITITGTNGKSTTSKLLYEIIKKNNKNVRLIGNIGKPVLSQIPKNCKTIFVIEASSYQIEYSKFFKTDISVILNISPDHLERHGSINNYVRAKFKLIKNQTRNGYAFINRKNKYLDHLIKKEKNLPKVIKVNNMPKVKIKKYINNSYFDNENNIQNLSFIMEISKKLGLNKNKIFKTVNSFTGLKFRQEIVYAGEKLLIINDSKSTSFSSSLNLLKSYKNIFWLVGGLYKKNDQFNLQKKYYKNINVYIFGKHKNYFINKFKNKLKIKIFGDIKNALNGIVDDIIKDKPYNYRKNIIFSPASASFDSFKNFEERGKYFNFLVSKLKIIKRINAK